MKKIIKGAGRKMSETKEDERSRSRVGGVR